MNDYHISREKLAFYLYILFVINFGKITGFGLSLKEKNMINKDIGIGSNMYNDHIILSVQTSSDNPEEIIKIIEDKLNNLQINKEDFEIVKKSYISNFVYYFSSVSSIVNYLYNDYYDSGKINNDKFMKYKEMNYEEFSKIFKEINLNNKSILIMKPKNKEE